MEAGTTVNWTSPLIILAAFALYGALHSFMAARTVKLWALERFGEDAMKRYYRLFFNIVSGVALLPIFLLMGLLPDTQLYRLSGWGAAAFILLELVGIAILWVAVNRTDSLDFLGLRQLLDPGVEPKLVTGSVYAWIRHPLYTGSMLVLWFLPFMTLNLLALIVAISLYFLVGAQLEERKLAKYFGQPYVDYKAKTGMFLPRF